MSTGPIPPQSATAMGIGTDVKCDNDEAEAQAVPPKSYSMATDGSMPNVAAEDQMSPPIGESSKGMDKD